MKLFSFKKPVVFCKGHAKVNNLARNHKFAILSKHLAVCGDDKQSGQHYTAYYNQDGEFEFIRLYSVKHSIAKHAWPQQYEHVASEIITAGGNILVENSKYSTNAAEKHKLVYRSFISVVDDEEVKIEFERAWQGWISTGEFPRKHFDYWINR